MSVRRRLPLLVTGLAVLAASASAGAQPERGGDRARPAAERGAQPRPLLDVRSAPPARANAAQDELRRSLGVHGVVDVDPLTGTPRVVAKLDGYLTGRSARDAKDVALDYVRANPGVFKLDEDDLAGLRLVRDYTDVEGIRHLHWVQTAGGIAAFDNDLRANVAADGRLINVLGSPLPDLAERAGGLAASLDATGALRAALASVGREARAPRVLARGRSPERATRFAGGHRAGLVFFNRGRELALGWDVTAYADGDEVYAAVVDAASGEILRRANKVEEATGLAWNYFPSTAAGGGATPRNFDAWLANPADTTRLFGPNAHVFSDLNDSNTVNAGEQINAAAGNWNHAFTKFNPDHDPFEARCDTEGAPFTSACSWDSFVGFSWQTNRRQNGTQVFYFVNNFHDHLENDPDIGFDNASGNFEGGDRVVAHSNDGANSAGGGFPNGDHLNNANMLTLPDGQSPRMQMYLFTWFNEDPNVDPTADANGGDDASVVYHEYAHGLSNRLITFGNGFGALDAHQSGAMGEAWSDFYAMDYLVAQGFETDGAGAGDVLMGAYLGNGQSIVRTSALDCATSDTGGNCGSGGYTYGDLGEILGFPQVHADGEIWGQTLWDLRQHPDVGFPAARELVTEGMRLSPPNPSFLDMRNAILQADTAVNGGLDEEHIWEVFAERGMGYFAATTGGHDTNPTENFDLPPAPGLAGTLSGVVRDPDLGNRPVAGVVVRIPGNPGNLSDVTNSLGEYSIPDVPAGTYPLVQATKSLYDGETKANVTVADDAVTTLNLKARRDWSARAGGARVSSFTPPDYSQFGCGPSGAIDQSLGTGWGSDTGADRQITVKLPVFVDVTHMAVDPGATCGDPDDASLKRFRLFVSRNGSSFTQVGPDVIFNATHNHKLNLIDVPNKNAIRFVRLTMISNQGHAGFKDMSELSVYGKLRPSCFGAAATKLGNDSSNSVSGTSGADVFVGLGGNDRFNGRGGNDLVCGGNGNDTLTGAGGTDKIDAGPGNDTVNSKDGRRETRIRGGSGTDRLRKDGNDSASGFERTF
ncbi:MAG TPA: M36 family metallopeptidase [Gaiellaceae bacterium]|nr:M36 family metallopeptidase [Gaiellaceae bacterium]